MKAFCFFTACLACLVASAQKSLAIDVYRFGHFKRFHIYQNEQLVYTLKGSLDRHRHTLTDMEDSVLYIETGESVRLADIRSIIIDRSNFLTRMLASGLKVAGIGYILIDAANSAGNQERIVKEQVLVPGLSLFAAGQLISLANKRRLRVGHFVTLKIIDLGLN